MPKVPFTFRDGSYLEVVGASIIGTEHHKNFRNNQDAFTWDTITNPHTFVAIVADGCSNKGEGANEVGAHLGSQMVKSSILNYAMREKFPFLSSKDEFWEDVNKDQYIQIGRVLASMGNPEQKNVDEWYRIIKSFGLFTINGVVINRTIAVFFSVGDGVVSINDDVSPIGTEYNNRPPYPMYNVTLNRVIYKKDQLQFVLNKILFLDNAGGKEADKFDSFLIGTDGVNDLIAAADSEIPGTTEKVGAISQFWKQSKYFEQNYALQTRLKLINSEVQKPETETLNGRPFPRIKRYPGLLSDDTTFIVGRRVYPRKDGRME